MNKVWKKGAVFVLAAAMCAGALSGCGKKSEAISVFTFDGKKVDGDLTNLSFALSRHRLMTSMPTMRR